MSDTSVSSPAPDPEPPSAPSLASIAGVFARYANFTVGGGSATIATLHGPIVRRLKWISEPQFHLAYALSRLTPGTNVLAFCTAVGWMARRGSGALIALAAASVPCATMAVAATHFYEVWQANGTFVAAMGGALAAAVAVMVNTAWILAEPHVRASFARAVVVIPTAILLVTVLALSPFQVLVLAAIGGLLWPAKGVTP